VFGADRDAWLSLGTDTTGTMMGTLSLIEPDAEYSVSGTCTQIGDYADVELRLNRGQPYIARIYQGDDGRIYMEGYQPGTPVKFALERHDQ
jgi:hypothetical protein